MKTRLKPLAYDPKIAGTLRSLSLESPPEKPAPERGDLRRLIAPGFLAVTVMAGIASAVFYRSDIARYPELARSTEVTPRVEPVVAPPPMTSREITGSGLVVAPQRTAVFSLYEGRITRIAVEAGSVVEAGQVLVTIEDAGARFALEQAKATEAAARLDLAARLIDLSQTRASLARIETLASRNATPQQALEEARTATERAENAVAQARQSLAGAELSIRIAEERLSELTVRAPFAGTVTRLDAHVGDTVLARADSVRENQSLLTIADTENLTIDADVAETALASLKPGLRGQAVLDGFPDQPFSIEVIRLSPVVSAEKGTLTLRLSLNNPPEGIRPNMAARIRIDTDNPGDTQ